jgi:hypothetical protein
MHQVFLGAVRSDRDGPRRYLPIQYKFDTRARILSMEIPEEWEPAMREQWLGMQQGIREGLIHQHGAEAYDRKVTDFTDLDVGPWSILDEHNVFLGQTRVAFTQGAYYPALVGACALGERILNELVLRLRDDFANHPTTAEIAGRRSLSDWNRGIEVLVTWSVLDDATATQFNELRKLRNKSVHYGEHLRGGDAREDALQALRLIQDCIQALFAPMGGPPRFIDGTIGQSFLSSASEAEPLVRRFFLPNCALVSPHFELKAHSEEQGLFAVFDDETYQENHPALTDEQFARHFNQHSGVA